MARPRWSDQDKQKAITMRKAGMQHVEIGAAIGRSAKSVQSMIKALRFPINGCASRGQVATEQIPDEVLEQQERRRDLRPRDLTAALMGDPLPQFSALDRMRQEGKSI